jgi:hypothetical protein
MPQAHHAQNHPDVPMRESGRHCAVLKDRCHSARKITSYYFITDAASGRSGYAVDDWSSMPYFAPSPVMHYVPRLPELVCYDMPPTETFKQCLRSQPDFLADLRSNLDVTITRQVIRRLLVGTGCQHCRYMYRSETEYTYTVAWPQMSSRIA